MALFACTPLRQHESDPKPAVLQGPLASTAAVCAGCFLRVKETSIVVEGLQVERITGNPIRQPQHSLAPVSAKFYPRVDAGSRTRRLVSASLRGKQKPALVGLGSPRCHKTPSLA